MIADPDTISDLLHQFEQHLHRQGWNNLTPTLLVLAASSQGDLLAVPLPIHRWTSRPDLQLVSIAEQLSHDVGGLTGQMAASPGFAGMVFAFESWSRLNMTDDEKAAYATNPNLSLGDMIPNGDAATTESREVLAVDTTGTCWWLHRDIGKYPHMETYPWDHSRHPVGAVVNTLRLMVIAVCERLPAGQHRIGPLAEFKDAIFADPCLFHVKEPVW